MTRSGAHVARSRQVTCPTCGTPRWMSERHALHVKNKRLTGICPECRLKPVTVKVTKDYKRYWLKRYTLNEIKEMAAGLDMLLNDHSRPAKAPRRVRQEDG